MRLPSIYYNAKCLKCSKVEKEMVRFGVLIFCNECFNVEFTIGLSLEKEAESYSRWLEEYKKEPI